MATDAEILPVVIATLARDGHFDAASIRISVVDAIVRLNGHVRTLQEKRDAQMIAAGIPGVRAVIDDIMVERIGRALSGDESLAERAYERLAANPVVPLDRIHISVREGVLTVRGDVDRPYQWQSLQTELQALEGIREVRNEVSTTMRREPAGRSGTR